MRRDFGTDRGVREIRGTQVLTISDEVFHSTLVVEGAMPFVVLSQFWLDRTSKLERYMHQIYSFTRSEYEGMYFGKVTVLDWPRLNLLSAPERNWYKGTKGGRGNGLTDSVNVFMV